MAGQQPKAERAKQERAVRALSEFFGTLPREGEAMAVAKAKKGRPVKGSGPSKSDLIREALGSGITQTAEIVAYVAKKGGGDVSPSQISNIKTKLASATSSKKSGSSKASAPSTPVQAAILLIDLAGGMDAAKEILAAIEKAAKVDLSKVIGPLSVEEFLAARKLGGSK